MSNSLWWCSLHLALDRLFGRFPLAGRHDHFLAHIFCRDGRDGGVQSGRR